MFAEVREKLIVEHGAPTLRSVYRARCDECGWISDDWATPASAAGEARSHNGKQHRFWGEPKMKINERKARRAEQMRKKKDVDDAIEIAEARLARLLEERAQLEKMPAEPTGIHSVVQFDVTFDPHGKRYSYAAIKAGGSWWLTGKHNIGLAWEDVLAFMSQDYHVEIGERGVIFVVHTDGGTLVEGAK